jgi:hypothetical protein
VRLLGTRLQSGTVPGTVRVPDLSGDGDAPPSPTPICPESGRLPRPRPRLAGDGDAGASHQPGIRAQAAPWSRATPTEWQGRSARAGNRRAPLGLGAPGAPRHRNSAKSTKGGVTQFFAQCSEETEKQGTKLTPTPPAQWTALAVTRAARVSRHPRVA